MEGVIPPALPVVDPGEGWDDDTEAKCTVIHFTSWEEHRFILIGIAWVNPRDAINSGWMFEKILETTN